MINLDFRGRIREETQIIYISSPTTEKYRLDNFFYREIKETTEPYEILKLPKVEFAFLIYKKVPKLNIFLKIY